MARHMTVLAFEDEEKDALTEVNDAKVFSRLVKPLTDQLRALGGKVKGVGSAKTVNSDEVQEALGSLQEMRQIIEKLPASEDKELQLERLGAAEEVLKDASNL